MTSRLVVFEVIAVILPGTPPMNELPTTAMDPIPKASDWAIRTWPRSVRGRRPKRSRKSLVTTALIELTPESMLDMAAANMAATTRPDTPGGRWKAM